MANSVDPDQTAPIGAVCSGSTLFASILDLSVMLGNYLQQTTSADDIFRCIFFLGALRVSLIARIGNCTVKILLLLEAPVFIKIMTFHREGGWAFFRGYSARKAINHAVAQIYW